MEDAPPLSLIDALSYENIGIKGALNPLPQQQGNTHSGGGVCVCMCVCVVTVYHSYSV